MKLLGKLSLILADSDEDYIDSLENYIRKHHAAGFDVYSFTDVQSLNRFFCGFGRRIDIILAGRGFIANGSLGEYAEAVFTMDDGKGAAGCKGRKTINKYQHAEKLITSLMSGYSVQNAAGTLPAGKSRTITTCFISPAGGSGKSTISACCSRICARRGLKTFYLNLEDVPSTDLFFKGDSEQTFSNVIFYLKSEDKNLDIKLAGAKCMDTSNGVHFFQQPESPLELLCLKPPYIERLIGCFRQSAAYDALFIDMSGGINEMSTAVMNACDRIVCVYGSDVLSSYKLTLLKKEFELLEKRQVPGLTEKLIYVVNDSKGSGFSSASTITEAEAPVILEQCGVFGNTTGMTYQQEFGTSFVTGISTLLERINPEWAIQKYEQAGGDDTFG